MPSKKAIDGAIKKVVDWHAEARPELIADLLKIPVEEAEVYIKEWLVDNPIIIPTHGPRPLGVPAPKPKKVKTTPVVTKPEPVKEAPPIPVVKKDIDPLPFIRWSMLVIGIASIGLSAFFSIDTLSTQLPALVAWIAGFVLVGFATIGAETAIYLFQRKKLMWIPLALLSAIIFLFSGTSIVSSLYNNYLSKQVEGEKVELVLDIAYKNYQKELDSITRFNEEKARVLAKVAPAYSLLAEFDTFEEQKEYATRYKEALIAVSTAEKSLKEIQANIDKAENTKDTLLKKYPEILLKEAEKKGIYDWLGGIFNVDSGFIQFLLSVIPAISLDFIGTLGLYVFFFVRKEE